MCVCAMRLRISSKRENGCDHKIRIADTDVVFADVRFYDYRVAGSHFCVQDSARLSVPLGPDYNCVFLPSTLMEAFTGSSGLVA